MMVGQVARQFCRLREVYSLVYGRRASGENGRKLPVSTRVGSESRLMDYLGLTSPHIPRQSDSYHQNHDRFRTSPVSMIKVSHVNAKNRRTPNPTHKPTQGEQEKFLHQTMR